MPDDTARTWGRLSTPCPTCRTSARSRNATPAVDRLSRNESLRRYPDPRDTAGMARRNLNLSLDLARQRLDDGGSKSRSGVRIASDAVVGNLQEDTVAALPEDHPDRAGPAVGEGV